MYDPAAEQGGRRGRGRTWRLVGLILMLPLGMIIAVVLLLIYPGGRASYPGGIFLVLLLVILALFVARMLFWGARRRRWQENRMERDPALILRQRYARGEITKEQFDQMMRDLRSPGNP